jgi:DNA-binding Lrp family transcriptional regulator
LEESGVIRRYVALLDAAKLGVGLTLFVRVWLTRQDDDTLNHFIEKIKRLSQVLECYVIVGDCDFLLRVVAEDLEDYRRFQSEQLTRIKGVQNVKTEIPSQIVKLTTELPIK